MSTRALHWVAESEEQSEAMEDRVARALEEATKNATSEAEELKQKKVAEMRQGQALEGSVCIPWAAIDAKFPRKNSSSCWCIWSALCLRSASRATRLA